MTKKPHKKQIITLREKDNPESTELWKKIEKIKKKKKYSKQTDVIEYLLKLGVEVYDGK